MGLEEIKIDPWLSPQIGIGFVANTNSYYLNHTLMPRNVQHKNQKQNRYRYILLKEVWKTKTN